MKLSKIDITHFRCFESLSVKLQPDTNVFVGTNGAGKSSILDAISIALYELVEANGAGGKRQRSSQKAGLEPTDIYVDPGISDPLVGRKPYVQVRATATELYPVGEFSKEVPSGRARTLDWTQHIRFSPPNVFRYDSRVSERLSQPYNYFHAIWQEIHTGSPKALIPLPAIAYYRAHRHIQGMPELGDIFKSDSDCVPSSSSAQK